MDNLFQLLIFLFIIYSIFNVIFGKKKTQGTGANVPGKPEGEGSTKSSRSSPPTDLLEEMLGYKTRETNNEYQEPKPNTGSTWIPPVIETGITDVKISEDSVPTPMDSNQTSSASPDQIKYSLASGNARTQELKYKIKNPSTLREFYLISEILNKPKALRR